MTHHWQGSFKRFTEKLTAESKERGWLFSVVAGWCMAFGVICLLLASIVAMKLPFVESDSVERIVQDTVRLFVIGGVIVASTVYMWKFNKWGRNIAISSVACLSWVVAEYIRQRTGAGISAQAMTVIFVAVSLSCFTSPTVRALFAREGERKQEDEEPGV